MTIETTRVHGFISQLDEFIEFLEGLEFYEETDLNSAWESVGLADELKDELYYVLEDLKDDATEG